MSGCAVGAISERARAADRRCMIPCVALDDADRDRVLNVLNG